MQGFFLFNFKENEPDEDYNSYKNPHSIKRGLQLQKNPQLKILKSRGFFKWLNN